MSGVESADLTQRVSLTLQRLDMGKGGNCFINICSDVLEQTRRIEERRREDRAGALATYLIGIKDNIALQGLPLTCGSRLLADYRVPYTASAVKKIQAADGLIVGKTNLDEFAMGSSGEYSAFGAVPNPHDSQRVSGGSSSGSAAAVARGLVDLALGSDTGGSVRQPAAFCGVVGLKPSYGRVSRYGLVSFAPSLDGIGILGRRVVDVAAMLAVIAGHDPADASTMDKPVPHYGKALLKPLQSLRIGLPKEYMTSVTDPAIRKSLNRLIRFLKDQGLHCREVSLPLTRYASACYYILAMAEASANLARFDGLRYGRRVKNADLDRRYGATRADGFGPEVKRRILLGTLILSKSLAARYYRQALKVRRLIRDEYHQIFKSVDVLLAATTTERAFVRRTRQREPLAMYAADILTLPANLAGLPALQLPVGFADGLPMGVQLIGAPFQEETICALGHYIERHFLEFEA